MGLNEIYDLIKIILKKLKMFLYKCNLILCTFYSRHQIQFLMAFLRNWILFYFLFFIFLLYFLRNLILFSIAFGEDI